MKKLLVVALALGLMGCSTAGPFVTGISSDGKGNIIVQKGYVQLNSWTGNIGNKEAGESVVKLGGEK